MRNRYEHILFDLDHTLWDFDANSIETLGELYDELELAEAGVTSFDSFISVYREVNRHYWQLHRNGQVDKHIIRNHRFHDALSSFGIYDHELALTLSDSYISRCPTKKNLVPHAESVLQYLLDQRYRLHIITNGFHETQMAKLDSSGLVDYFDEIVTSETAGCTKPDERIFQHLIRKAKAANNSCLMIGDNLESDIRGARNVSIDQVYFNPRKKQHAERVTYEIACLSTIPQLL